VIIGTAGWSIPRELATSIPGEGTALARYARRFGGVEINSSAYRDHSAATFGRWARQTPRGFRFAVKLPQRITHDARLRAARQPLEQFLEDVAGLGRRLGPLIVQLPPSMPFESRVATRFFTLLRERFEGDIACEPRHASWFELPADRSLVRHRIARIAADPAVVPAAAEPGGWPGLVYYRLHGSPRKYWSVYEPERIAQWSHALRSVPRSTRAWCIFDNTASGGAAFNALQLLNADPPARRSRGSSSSDRHPPAA
jgi:uncharacterized protein YecE (DUF72 family)